MHPTPTSPARANAVTMSMAGFAIGCANAAQLAPLREHPHLPPDRSVPLGFLKHSDHQTVLALATISKAMSFLKEPTDNYRNWGVVAAANLFGRAGILRGLMDYRQDGPWGITPHLIPHHSLHAMSGTISQSLRIHGPNFGIGGGPTAVAEAFLVAATMISENNLPGLWVVLCGHEEECFSSAPNSDSPHTSPYLAAAVALKPPGCANSKTCLRVCGDAEIEVDWPEFSLTQFMENLVHELPAGCWA